MLSRTKKFFKKGIQTVKSYFSDGYEKLPKTPSYNGRENTGFSLENTCSEVAGEWEAKERVMVNEKDTSNSEHKKPFMAIGYHEVDIRKEQKIEDKSSTQREEKRCLVMKRLKELETFDRSDVDLAHDIQEVIYLYSRLTCPIYCEIVEKFSTEIYFEVFLLSPGNSKLRRMLA